MRIKLGNAWEALSPEPNMYQVLPKNVYTLLIAENEMYLNKHPVHDLSSPSCDSVMGCLATPFCCPLRLLPAFHYYEKPCYKYLATLPSP